MWRKTTLALGLVILAVLLAYRSTAWGMADIWWRSDTFTHGFMVVPISLWLIWRQRDRLQQHVPQPALWLLPLCLPLGFVWLLAELAAVNVVTQFALVGLLILSVMILLGLELARRLVFPLAFLLFAVPFGEFALPQLMEWTAHFTVWALRLTGVPVYREGLGFVIPSGHWSVVEACSGIRYLIASMMVGTLYAYLNYRSWRRRAVFVLVAFLVPIVANWLRAYLIVMLGHLSGNRLAAGVDHLIYGWVFFGIVIMAMFWIGARWREDEPESERAEAAAGAATWMDNPRASRQLMLAVPLVLTCVLVWPLWHNRLEQTHPAAPLAIAAPVLADGGWSAAAMPPADWQPEMTNPDARLQTAYQSTVAASSIGLDISWYRQQQRAHKLVTSVNSLAAPQNQVWKNLGTRPQSTGVAELPQLLGTRLMGADGHHLLLWSWYWVDGKVLLSPARALLRTALTRLAGQRDDAALVVVYTRYEAGQEDLARQQLQGFLQTAAPAIAAALEKTRKQ